MEFKFNINALLKEDITKLTCDTLATRSHNYNSPSNYLRGYSGGGNNVGVGGGGGGSLASVIDCVGKASASAQSLSGVITTSHRLLTSSHHLYIMKDSTGNNGFGTIVGILKVGEKKLFVLDHQGAMHEMMPLCILDFYIHESKQRKGCGRRLFDYMLRCEGVQPEQLAIDKPSPKLMSFMLKHFQLRATVAQVNNFVIFESFFSKRLPSRSDIPTRPDTLTGRRKPPLPPNTKSAPYNGRRIEGRRLGSEAAVLPPIPSSPQRDQDWAQTHAQSTEYLNNMDISDNIGRDRLQSPTHWSAPSSPMLLQRHKLEDQYNHIPVRKSSLDHQRDDPPMGSRVSRGEVYTPGVTDPVRQRRNSQDKSEDQLSAEIAELKQVLHRSPPGELQGRRDSAPSMGSPPVSPDKVSYVNSAGNYCLPTNRKPRLHSSWNVLGVPPSHETNNNTIWQRNQRGGSTRLW